MIRSAHTNIANICTQSLSENDSPEIEVESSIKIIDNQARCLIFDRFYLGWIYMHASAINDVSKEFNSLNDPSIVLTEQYVGSQGEMKPIDMVALEATGGAPGIKSIFGIPTGSRGRPGKSNLKYFRKISDD
ncbi:hypothetical protein Tco_0732547 [Tanacetum coccineum]